MDFGAGEVRVSVSSEGERSYPLSPPSSGTGTTLGAIVSTAIHKDAAADQCSSSGTMVGIAGDELHRDQHAAAAANPYMACVREEHPYIACVHEEELRPRGCCSSSRKCDMMLAAAATFFIVIGMALGVGLDVGLRKGKSRGFLDASLTKLQDLQVGTGSDSHLDCM